MVWFWQFHIALIQSFLDVKVPNLHSTKKVIIVMELAATREDSFPLVPKGRKPSLKNSNSFECVTHIYFINAPYSDNALPAF